MNDSEFTEKWPTGMFRWYTPNAQYVPERLEQQFCCADEFGHGKLWLEPEPAYRQPLEAGDKAP